MHQDTQLDRLTEIWLGLVNLFQTLPELDEVKDKSVEVRAMRELLDGLDDLGEHDFQLG